MGSVCDTMRESSAGEQTNETKVIKSAGCAIGFWFNFDARISGVLSIKVVFMALPVIIVAPLRKK